ncbi:MAG: hypothetical protein JXB34_00080 [Bacteroidales bacterium]|nr:hypothetical protein [Bacteroidales bacterium]
MARKKRILLFEEFESIRNILVKTLEKKDAETIIVSSFNDAKKQLNGTGFSMAIIDFDNKNHQSLELIKYMRETSSYIFTPIILLITGNKEQFTDRLSGYNIACYLTKPFDMALFNSVTDRFK